MEFNNITFSDGEEVTSFDLDFIIQEHTKDFMSENDTIETYGQLYDLIDEVFTYLFYPENEYQNIYSYIENYIYEMLENHDYNPEGIFRKEDEKIAKIGEITYD
tara:strand:+ start:972 stop:1283 length:312 start_codon:yes stop_codon:yes gene_type:complete